MTNNGSSLNDSYMYGAEDNPIDEKLQAIVVPVIFGLILIVGVIGNGSLILIVFRNKQMRSIPNIYIVSLALGDFLLIVIVVPFEAFVFTFPSWLFGEPLCKANYYMQTLSLGVSVFTLTLLSIDRYMAISHPMRQRSAASMKKTVCRAALVWIVSSCLAIPDALSAGLMYDAGFGVTFCDPYQADWAPWYSTFNVTYRFLIFFACPILIICICYCLMAHTLVSSGGHILVDAQSHRQTRTANTRTNIAKIVLSFVLVFVICWLPRHIFLLGYHYGLMDFNFFWYVFKILGFCLAFINSCMNPLALYLQSEQYRKYFCRYFCCCVFDSIQRSGTDNTQPTYTTQYNFSRGANGCNSTQLKVYKEY